MNKETIPVDAGLIVVLGPTACGKTHYAVSLAAELDAEIISADSRQVYCGMDIGTGKDLSEYTLPNGRVIPYHLIDICQAGEKYNVFEYQRDFLTVYEEILSRGKRAILCGGTGLYIESVLKGYELIEVPENKELRSQLAQKSMDQLVQLLADYKIKHGQKMHNKTDIDTPKRAIRAIEIEAYYDEHPDDRVAHEKKFPELHPYIIGLDVDRELRRERISRRLKTRLEQGMVEEVKSLLDKGIPAEDLIYYGLEYKYLTLYLTGQLGYEDMFSGLETSIHQFAKRQMTWFRGMERRGFEIHWITP